VVGAWVAQYNDIKTRLRAGESGVRFPAGKNVFVFSMTSRQPPTQYVTVFFQGAKAAGAGS